MIDSRQIVLLLPGRPDKGGAGHVIDRQGLRPCPSGTATASEDLVPCIARVKSGTPPGHDKEPSRASERAAWPFRQASCDDSRNIA